MENLTRDTINKIEEMAKVENEIIDVDGKTYSKSKLYEVRSARPILDSLSTSSLKGFVAYVKHIIEKSGQPLPVIININSDGIVAKTGLIEGTERDTIVTAKPSPIDIYYGRYKTLEETIIGLQTKFVRTEVVEKLLETLKCLVIDNTVAVEDDGISQKVTVANGAGIRSEIKLSPIVRLRPYTTFFELEQPERVFLLRVDKQGSVALFEADGNSYKQTIIDTTRAYLESAFAEEVDNKLVVIA